MKLLTFLSMACYILCSGCYRFMVHEIVIAAGNSADGRWACQVIDRRVFLGVDTNLQFVLTEYDGGSVISRHEYRSPDVSQRLARSLVVTWDDENAAFLFQGNHGNTRHEDAKTESHPHPVVLLFCTREKQFFHNFEQGGNLATLDCWPTCCETDE